MHRKLCTTLRTFPSFLLAFEERIHAMFFNERQILHHAHAVIFAIARIELFHAGTGVGGAIVAKAGIGLCQFFTIKDHALSAAARAVAFFGPAPIAGIFLAHMPNANVAVHTTRRN